MTPFQVSVGEQSVLESTKGPETVMLLTETPVVPVFVTQTLLAALIVPTVTDPKETLVGETDTAVVVGVGAGGGGSPPQAPPSAQAVAEFRALKSTAISVPSVATPLEGLRAERA